MHVAGLINVNREFVRIARGYGRPLWIGINGTHGALIWTSTLRAMEDAEHYLQFFSLNFQCARANIEIHGQILSYNDFHADTDAQWLDNPVASPLEKISCLRQIEQQLESLVMVDEFGDADQQIA